MRHLRLKDGKYLLSFQRLVNSQIRKGIPGFVIPYQVLLLSDKITPNAKPGVLKLLKDS